LHGGIWASIHDNDSLGPPESTTQTASSWAEAKNLKANQSKYAEIIFAGGRRRTEQNKKPSYR